MTLFGLTVSQSDVIALVAIIAGFIGVAIPIVMGELRERKENRLRLEYRIDSLAGGVQLASSHVLQSRPVPKPLKQYLGALSQSLATEYAQDAYEVSRRLRRASRDAANRHGRPPIEGWHLLTSALYDRLQSSPVGRDELMFASGAIAIATLALIDGSDKKQRETLCNLIKQGADWSRELASLGGLLGVMD